MMPITKGRRGKDTVRDRVSRIMGTMPRVKKPN
jgi:hypothetical protein